MNSNFDSIVFSDLIKHNGDVKVTINRQGLALAYAVQNELVVAGVKSRESPTRFICDFSIDFISWSPDSELICCCMSKQKLIQVWCITDPSWRCKISEDLLEISNIAWAPDSKHILVTCESNFKITVWSLVSTGFTLIENPKLIENCFSFSSCSKYMAVVQRKDFTDRISVYSCDDWRLVKCFPVDTENVAEIYFSASDLIIAVLAAVTVEHKVLFYSLNGKLISTFSNNDEVLGITSFSWSPNSTYVLFGDFSEKITFLHGRLYNEICNFSLPESIHSQNINVYKFVSKPCNDENVEDDFFVSKPCSDENVEYDILQKWEFYEVVDEKPINISQIFDTKKMRNKYFKSGISLLQVSNDEEYIAVVGNSMPNIIFMFSLETFAISDIIVHSSKIESLAWHPKKPILAICCGSSYLDLWVPTCCIHVVSPYENKLQIQHFEWHPEEDSLILNGKDTSTVLHLP